MIWSLSLPLSRFFVCNLAKGISAISEKRIPDRNAKSIPNLKQNSIDIYQPQYFSNF